jgi:formate-dependent phosphoribosylglycinamide formyltransferase (GAR transformylase)
MKKALILAGGLPQIELINEMKARGYYTILIDYNTHPIAEKVADKFYQVSTLDIDEVRKIVKTEKVTIITTCCTDQALATVSLLSQEFNLPCYIDAEIGKVVTNKQYMKQIFLNENIPSAGFVIVENENQEIDFKFPMVVKPVDCNSSKGVIKVFDTIHLKEAISQAISFSRTRKAIVEEYIEGIELSIDAFVIDGKVKILSTSQNIKIPDKSKFVIYKSQYPAKLSDQLFLDMKEIVQRIANVFKLSNSPMIIQMIVNNDGLHVIEFSARTGGCVKYRMIEIASGTNIIKATVDLFEMKKPTIFSKHFKGHIINEFVYCKNGIFDHICGIEKCIESGWIQEAYELKTSGVSFDKVQSSGDRVAALIYVVDNYEQYITNHNYVVDNLKVIDIQGEDIMRHDLLPKI